MTIAPDVEPLIADDPAGAVRALRGSGLRITAGRRLLISALFEADGPVSAAHLVQGRSLEESSVYRNLEVLERHGLVRHLHLGHGPGLYVLASRQEVEYLYCERCTKVVALAPARLDPIRKEVRTRFGLTPRFTHFAIVGTCDECEGGGVNRAPSDHRALHSHGDYVHAHDQRGTHSHRR